MFNTKLKSEDVTALFEAMLTLKSVDEFYMFFDDVCTIGEIRDIAQRFQVARLLDEGVTYTDIAESTNASTATISRVKKCLSYGADGYRLALDRLKCTPKK